MLKQKQNGCIAMIVLPAIKISCGPVRQRDTQTVTQWRHRGDGGTCDKPIGHVVVWLVSTENTCANALSPSLSLSLSLFLVITMPPYGCHDCLVCSGQIVKREVCFFVWCSTARQHRIGQFVPTAGGWNRLSWLRMANETQCIILDTLHNVTQFTIKHSSYKNATTGYLIVRLTCLNITLAPSPIPNRITHSLFGIIISLGGMQFCVMPRTLYDSSHFCT